MKGHLVTFAACVSLLSVYAGGQEKVNCPYVVAKVSFEDPSGLTGEQLEKLRTLAMGRCYDPVNAVFFSQYLYEELQEWGCCKPTVYDPNTFQVLDSSIHPSPIAVTLDFRLTTAKADRK
jgi:hypothetical protein